MSVRILTGDCREILKTLPSGSVNCVVTSPPYFALRDYGSPGQIGLEQTPDQFVSELVFLFREARRVLTDDGTIWLNLGDSYCSTDKWGGGVGGNTGKHTIADNGEVPSWAVRRRRKHFDGIKPKDLIGIPWMVAKALQSPFYRGRIQRERDRAWLAAILDAEGTICGFTHVRDTGNVRTGALIFITNTSGLLLGECDRIWPGARRSLHCAVGDVAPSGAATKECWRWIIPSAEEKLAFVQEVYPYLVEKRRQAVCAYNLLLLAVASKRNGRSGDSEDTKEKRAVLVGMLSRLNAGDAVDFPSWVVEPPSLYEDGWFLRGDHVWAKPNCMPESVEDRPTRGHEYVFLLSKSSRYYYDHEAVRTAPKASSITRLRQNVEAQTGSARANGGAKTNGAMKAVARRSDKQRGHSRRHAGFNDRWDAMERSEQQINGANLRSVWWVPPARFKEAHFAVMPDLVAEICIRAGCPEGGTVLDPFFGAGTTGLVSDRLGRNCIGIELNPEYAEIAKRRIEAEAAMFADVSIEKAA